MCPSIHVEASHTPLDQTNLSHVAKIAPKCDLLHATKNEAVLWKYHFKRSGVISGDNPLSPMDLVFRKVELQVYESVAKQIWCAN